MNCEDLVNIPLLKKGLTLISGANGIRNNISWIYFADCVQCLDEEYNISELIHGGEMVIITNKSLTDDDNKIIDIIKVMYPKKIAAVVINENQISKKIADYCEELNLPLFELSVELHLIDFSQIVCKRLIEEESETHSREKLLTSILFVDNFNEYEVTKRATHYGITISGKQAVAIIKTVGLNDPASIKRIQNLVENEFRYYDINKLLIYSQFEAIVVMFPLDVFGRDSVVHFFEKIADKIRKDFEIEAYIGIGLWYEYLADVRESYTEAKSALQLISMEKQKYVLSYNDMGIHSLISQIRSHRTLDNYINDKLGKLIEADKVQDSELCNTLRAYIENNCNSNATAELLFIHRNTMRYRLDKIEKILNVDLDDLSVCLELKLAFIILDFRNSRKNWYVHNAQEWL